jgi:hypothetical protein
MPDQLADIARRIEASAVEVARFNDREDTRDRSRQHRFWGAVAVAGVVVLLLGFLVIRSFIASADRAATREAAEQVREANCGLYLLLLGQRGQSAPGLTQEQRDLQNKFWAQLQLSIGQLGCTPAEPIQSSAPPPPTGS